MIEPYNPAELREMGLTSELPSSLPSGYSYLTAVAEDPNTTGRFQYELIALGVVIPGYGAVWTTELTRGSSEQIRVTDTGVFAVDPDDPDAIPRMLRPIGDLQKTAGTKALSALPDVDGVWVWEPAVHRDWEEINSNGVTFFRNTRTGEVRTMVPTGQYLFRTQGGETFNRYGRRLVTKPDRRDADTVTMTAGTEPPSGGGGGGSDDDDAAAAERAEELDKLARMIFERAQPFIALIARARAATTTHDVPELLEDLRQLALAGEAIQKARGQLASAAPAAPAAEDVFTMAHYNSLLSETHDEMGVVFENWPPPIAPDDVPAINHAEAAVLGPPGIPGYPLVFPTEAEVAASRHTDETLVKRFLSQMTSAGAFRFGAVVPKDNLTALERMLLIHFVARNIAVHFNFTRGARTEREPNKLTMGARVPLEDVLYRTEWERLKAAMAAYYPTGEVASLANEASYKVVFKALREHLWGRDGNVKLAWADTLQRHALNSGQVLTKLGMWGRPAEEILAALVMWNQADAGYGPLSQPIVDLEAIREVVMNPKVESVKMNNPRYFWPHRHDLGSSLKLDTVDGTEVFRVYHGDESFEWRVDPDSGRVLSAKYTGQERLELEWVLVSQPWRLWP